MPDQPDYDPAEVVSPDEQMAAAPADDLAAAAADVQDYWTEARMRNAAPVPLPPANLNLIPVWMAARVMAAAAADAAGPDQMNLLTRVEPAPPDSPAAADAVSGVTATPVANMAVYPYAVVGKLFMTFPFGDFVGSAWVIAERAVFTAGHCVLGESPQHTQRAWATNLLFRAQFRNGQDVGSWPLVQKASLKEWVQNGGWWGYDMGAGIAATPIRPKTGRAGYLANQDPAGLGPFLSVGYPKAGRFEPGLIMYECEGGYVTSPPGQQLVYGMANDMLGGCSGGPIFTRGGGTPLVCGLNSFITSSRPGVMHSPVFQSQFLRLVKWIKDNGGDSASPAGTASGNTPAATPAGGNGARRAGQPGRR